LRGIIGLGNPGFKYQLTRHNIGFLILDRFAEKHNLQFKPSKYDFYYSEGTLGPSDFFLIKPTTFMNLSGIAVLNAMEHFNSNISELLIIYDDLYTQFPQIRIRNKGGDGGHNGIKSIIYHLNTNEFARIKMGIGQQSPINNLSNFVLDNFSEVELKKLDESFPLLMELIEHFIIGGYQKSLNHFSKKSKELKKELNNQKDYREGTS
jgi:PTH1 family peptidyl-tRNA hydrolase